MRLRLSLPILASLLAAGLLVAASPADAARKIKHHAKPAAHATLAHTNTGASKSKLLAPNKAKLVAKKKKHGTVA